MPMEQNIHDVWTFIKIKLMQCKSLIGGYI